MEGLGVKPGKKRAVFGRDFAVVEFHLVRLEMLNDAITLCGVRKGLCRRRGLQLLSQSRPKVRVSCFIS